MIGVTVVVVAMTASNPDSFSLLMNPSAPGAAAAPQMGLGTMRYLSFWLALLNVRLSYWLKRPGKTLPWADAPGLFYLLQEMFGRMHEGGRFLNLSDGGHMENLGVYELLRRRCKYIVAVDGEHDPQMTFAALTTLQRLAFIDLGVTVDIDLDDLRLKQRPEHLQSQFTLLTTDHRPLV